jgi:hypothetical protein
MPEGPTLPLVTASLTAPHLREHPQPTKLALLCALLMMREREVTDTLAQLLISTIHRINAHAEQKVVADPPRLRQGHDAAQARRSVPQGARRQRA